MSKQLEATYQVDARWQIIMANEEFCRLFRSTESGLIGRDVRDLLREDWRHDFRRYVARALVGAGEHAVTVPMLAPCGDELWCNHDLTPLIINGAPEGFRATIAPRQATVLQGPNHWWHGLAQHLVWDTELDTLARAS